MPSSDVSVATYSPRDGGWIVTAGPATSKPHEAPEATAFGRTLEKARQAIVRELADSRTTYAGAVAVRDHVLLSPEGESALEAARNARELASAAATSSTAATVEAANTLSRDGLGLRDIGYLLGISHARVHQLIAAGSTPVTESIQDRENQRSAK